MCHEATKKSKSFQLIGNLNGFPYEIIRTRPERITQIYQNISKVHWTSQIKSGDWEIIHFFGSTILLS